MLPKELLRRLGVSLAQLETLRLSGAIQRSEEVSMLSHAIESVSDLIKWDLKHHERDEEG